MLPSIQVLQASSEFASKPGKKPQRSFAKYNCQFHLATQGRAYDGVRSDLLMHSPGRAGRRGLEHSCLRILFRHAALDAVPRRHDGVAPVRFARRSLFGFVKKIASLRFSRSVMELSGAIRSISIFAIAGAFAFAVISMTVVTLPAQAQTSQIVDTIMYDTSGNPIEAQGGAIAQWGSTFYWYGGAYSSNGDGGNQTVGVNLYTSSDLVHWTSHGNVIDLSSIPGWSNSQWIGRPNVTYVSSTNQYVMFSEWSGGEGGDRNAFTIYTSSSPYGPFTYYSYNSYPCGYTMGDLGKPLTDSTGSYISLTEDYPYTNGSICMVSINSDFLGLGSIKSVLTPSGGKEASELLKPGSEYVLLTSDTNGWNSSGTTMWWATSMAGPWNWGYYITTSPSSSNSFDTQHDQVLAITGTSGTAYVYLGDRWTNFGGSSGPGQNMFYPITFDASEDYFPTLYGDTNWYLNIGAGTWSTSPLTSPITSGNTYYITSESSGLLLDDPAFSTSNGTGMIQWQENGGTNQQWTATAVGSYWTFTNVASGLLLEDPGFSTTEGTQLDQWESNGGSNQRWAVIAVGDGSYELMNAVSGQLMDVYGNSNSNDAPIIQLPNNGNTNQHWTFQAQ